MAQYSQQGVFRRLLDARRHDRQQSTSSRGTADERERDGLYTPLPSGHLRLLQIHGDTDGVIRCTLTPYASANAPDYIAVSYTWGSPEDPMEMDTPLGSQFPTGTHTIRVNDHDFEIKQNLHDLFEELVKESQGRLYWIDALCLNQDDEVEKSDQVRQMGKTYHGANTVLVWLGKAYTSISRVVFIMEQMYKNYGPHWREIDDLQELHQLRLLGLEDTTAIDWYDFICFMKRSWFSRTWTAQEFTLAKAIDFRCGPVSLDSNALVTLSQWIWSTSLLNAVGSIWCQVTGEVGEFSGISVADVCSTIRRVASGIKPEEKDPAALSISQDTDIWYSTARANLGMPAFFSFMLRVTTSLRCSDPRDKIFALLGMAQMLFPDGSVSAPNIRVDYSVNVADLYTDTMAYLLNGLGNLTILSLSQLSRERLVLDLPSWVVDFGYVDRFSAVLDHDARNSLHPRTFDASRQRRLGFSIYGRAIVVHHFSYATVTAVSETWRDIKFTRSLESVFQLFLLRSEIYGPCFMDDIWKTILCDSMSINYKHYTEDELRLGFRDTILHLNILKLHSMNAGGYTQDVVISSEMHYQTLSASLDSTSTIPSPHEAIALYPEWQSQHHVLDTTSVQFQLAVSEFMTYRRLMLLDNGQLGVAAIGTRPGDQVCIVADGVKTPLVLRQAGTNNENEWLLIGEAYVKSIMFGEAVDQMKDLGKTWEKICLV